MKALFVKTVEGETVVNLDAVTHIEFDAKGQPPSLDIYLNNGLIRFPLSQAIRHYHVMDRLHTSLRPLYDSRQGTVLGIELSLDVTDFQVRGETRF